jgi:hypothetical protein
MWCPTCRGDNPAQLSADDQRLLCVRCGGDLGLSAAALSRAKGLSTGPADLLAKWAAEDRLRPIVAEPTVAAHATEVATAQPPLRLDATLVERDSVADRPSEVASVATFPLRPQAPHSRSRRGSGWLLTIAQLTTYAGILVLTIGSVWVLQSLYGGRPSQGLQGWLLATVGQMLLLLGVVTQLSHNVEAVRRELRRQQRHPRRRNASRNAVGRRAA